MTTDAKISQMADIEAAADKRIAVWKNMVDEHKLMFSDLKIAFMRGAEWRDKNPSPAVKGLVETLKDIKNCLAYELSEHANNIMNCSLDADEIVMRNQYKKADAAIKSYDESLKRE